MNSDTYPSWLSGALHNPFTVHLPIHSSAVSCMQTIRIPEIAMLTKQSHLHTKVTSRDERWASTAPVGSHLLP